MALHLKTPATALAVELPDCKQHLRVDDDDDDTLITAMIHAATEAAEQLTGRALMPQTWLLSSDAFPAFLELTRTPVVSITSIKYVADSGVLTTLNPALYTLHNQDDFAHATVEPAFGTSWPTTRGQTGAVQVEYLAGYADAAALPPSIASWIKLQVGAMFENREAETAVQTYALGFADRLLDRYKVWGC